MLVKNYFWDEIEHSSSKEYGPEINVACTVDVLDRAIEDCEAIPPYYIKDHASRIMDMIERLEKMIGISSDGTKPSN